METIYYGYVPPARDRRPSEGRPGVVLRATRGVRNNIPYTCATLKYIYIRNPLSFNLSPKYLLINSNLTFAAPIPLILFSNVTLFSVN